MPEAARGCDVLVASGSVMVATRSVAELLDIAYVHAHYCPATVPSEHHAPAPWPGCERPLSDDLESFLDGGEPPVHFGLGSMPAPGHDAGDPLVRAARALGRRAILSAGWADLSPTAGGTDCLVIGEANHQAPTAHVSPHTT